MGNKLYTKQQKEDNKIYLNIEIKPANEFQKKLLTNLLNSIRGCSSMINSYHRDNEVNIYTNITN